MGDRKNLAQKIPWEVEREKRRCGRLAGKKKYWRGITVLLVLIVLVVLWGFNNFTFRVTHTEIQSEKIITPVRIALISDLHGAQYGGDNCFRVSAVRRENPDLILVTGDMYSSDHPEDQEIAVTLMAQLAEIAETYFVPGEHDRNRQYYNALDEAGVRVLSYSYASLSVGETRLTLYGITNAYFSPTFDLENAFDTPGTETYNILMAHIPNAEAYAKWGPDLSVCGDTHGGIVQLPLWGPLYYQGTWLPKVDGVENVYDQGLFKVGEMKLYVSAGLGNYPYPLRFLNRPELAMITLTPET